jgi:hypothetical protein
MVEDRTVRRRSGTPASVLLRPLCFSVICMFESPRLKFRRHLSCSRTHSTDTHQVVGQTGQAHQLLVAPNASQSGLAQAADRFAPTKELLDAFAHDLTGPITGRFERTFTKAGRVVSGAEGVACDNPYRHRRSLGAGACAAGGPPAPGPHQAPSHLPRE